MGQQLKQIHRADFTQAKPLNLYHYDLSTPVPTKFVPLSCRSSNSARCLVMNWNRDSRKASGSSTGPSYRLPAARPRSCSWIMDTKQKTTSRWSRHQLRDPNQCRYQGEASAASIDSFTISFRRPFVLEESCLEHENHPFS